MFKKLKVVPTEGKPRYALVVSRKGQVLSSTFDEARAGKFDEATQDAVVVYYAKKKEKCKGFDTEFEFVG